MAGEDNNGTGGVDLEGIRVQLASSSTALRLSCLDILEEKLRATGESSLYRIESS
jgi:hypothetical protein